LITAPKFVLIIGWTGQEPVNEPTQDVYARAHLARANEREEGPGDARPGVWAIAPEKKVETKATNEPSQGGLYTWITDIRSFESSFLGETPTPSGSHPSILLHLRMKPASENQQKNAQKGNESTQAARLCT
jgi:hypothetical protein